MRGWREMAFDATGLYYSHEFFSCLFFPGKNPTCRFPFATIISSLLQLLPKKKNFFIRASQQLDNKYTTLAMPRFFMVNGYFLSLQYFNLSQEIVVLRYLHCIVLLCINMAATRRKNLIH